MPRACPVETHVACYFGGQGMKSNQREAPRCKPVASSASPTIVVATSVKLQRDKPVASSEFSHALCVVGLSALPGVIPF